MKQSAVAMKLHVGAALAADLDVQTVPCGQLLSEEQALPTCKHFNVRQVDIFRECTEDFSIENLCKVRHFLA